jgi:hypothetical protein
MAYTTGKPVTTKVHSATLSSHCIPAYPEYRTSTTFDAAFYTARRASNDELVGGTVTYSVTTP